MPRDEEEMDLQLYFIVSSAAGFPIIVEADSSGERQTNDYHVDARRKASGAIGGQSSRMSGREPAAPGFVLPRAGTVELRIPKHPAVEL